MPALLAARPTPPSVDVVLLPQADGTPSSVVVEPGGRIQRVGGFRSGLTALWWRMARECE